MEKKRPRTRYRQIMIYILTVVVFILSWNHDSVASSVEGVMENATTKTTTTVQTTRGNLTQESSSSGLEGHITNILQELQRLKEEHGNLSRRVSFLEMCDCQPKRCHDEGTTRIHGDTWSKGPCHVCRCHNGETTCFVPNTPKCRQPKGCRCQHGGLCVEEGGVSGGSSRCVCPYGCTGARCQYLPTNPCVFLPLPGDCAKLGFDANLTGSVQRYYYNWHSQTCHVFSYSGCGGSANNFPTRRKCEQLCLRGACCRRRLYPPGHPYKPAKECKDLDLDSCRALVKGTSSLLEVVSFRPGSSCDQAGCGQPSGCHDGLDTYHPSQRFKLGCEEDCRCEDSGKISCGCSKTVQRKELRDLSALERWRLQRAIAELREPLPEGAPSIWERLRDLYSKHIMHATHPRYFLLWHQKFLRLVERKLQQIDCDVTIPYYDISADAGAFHTAFLWQGNFFGGQGHVERDLCVGGHPFGNSTIWRPCILRNFNRSIHIPSILEIAQILKTNDFQELTEGLQTLAAYIHTFIGGTMATTYCFYDPVFLPVYTYIDKLFQAWLEHPGNSERLSSEGHYLEPFGVTSYGDATCVEYVEPSKGRPCTESESDVISWVGYDLDGYDSIGYDIHGFSRLGYNRDGYDREGYDPDSFDRYGFSIEGYNRHGFDKDGQYQNGSQENGNIYDSQGLDCYCRNRAAFDQLGYDRYNYNGQGLDTRGCGFGFNGPFSPRLVLNLWTWLWKQSPVILSSLGRTCPQLLPVDDTWWRQCWNRPSFRITDLSPTEAPLYPGRVNRLCVQLEPIYSTSCSCPGGQVTCAANPCLGAFCATDPHATCYMDTCGSCTAMWIQNHRRVICEEDNKIQDFCQPNPCLHGGTCGPSRWPERPEDVVCHCPSMYEGIRCERLATQVCLHSNLATGSCSNFKTRWYFDVSSRTCQSFKYGGCGGGPNNFPTKYHCERTCVIGACCVRTQKTRGLYGYDIAGYDRYGFNTKGQSASGKIRDVNNGLASGDGVYDPTGFDFRGYDRDGYDQEGYNRFGYNRNGLDPDGYNATGFSGIGEFDGDISYNEMGYNKEGYNRAGLDCQGSKPTGLDSSGLISGFEFTCHYTSQEECLDLTSDTRSSSHVSFSPGLKCYQAQCSRNCNCQYALDTFKHSEIIKVGCNIIGVCNDHNTIDFTCKGLRHRKEIRDLTPEEWIKFHTAIQGLMNSYKWVQFTALYVKHVHTLDEGAVFLPWLRYFLHQVESELMSVDCDVTIPYFDWTLDAGDMRSSWAWQANAFGGDGEDQDNCVKRHPFQDPFSLWEPCLQRNFSVHSPLPHTLHIHHILREPDFLSFSTKLKHASQLFKTWVGGHLLTDHAVYDPLFLSHSAYLDKLWADWQQRHPYSVFSFPAGERFMPMSPFQTPPENVFNSEKLLCVKYMKLTKGTTCHLPEKTEGPWLKPSEFDLDGYNVFGYDEHGFDSQGYNPQGFNRRTFNRDGYDIHGYNKYGYDRYGFDIHGYTASGFHRDGTHRNTINEVNVIPGYNTHGFDHHGFNKYGYDRNAYDIFGFDSNGFDVNNCSHFNNGPFYVLQKVHLDDILDKLNQSSLEALPVNCPNIEGLFPFQPIPAFPDSSDNPGVLLPEQIASTRFCTTLPPRNGCGLGYYETLCLEDLCKEAYCLRKEGVSCWTRGCSGTCEPYWYNLTTGAPVTCSGCLLGRDVYTHGEAVPTVAGSCQECSCHYGNIVCEPMPCESVSVECQNVTTLPGDCCPQCRDCDKMVERQWRDDLCRLCSCEDGVIHCVEAPCPTIECSHPAPPRPPSQCCPTCQECSYEGGLMHHGEEFRPDPCRVCHCNRGNVHCDTEQCPPIDCYEPVHVPGKCCPQCTTECVYEGEVHPDGEVFHPHYNPCLACTCQQSRVRCTPVQCPPVQLPCQHPITMSGECCPAKCPECDFKGSLFEHGEEWSDGGCRTCRCEEGAVQCKLNQPCPPLSCSHGATPPGACCPVCADCMYEGERREDGSLFSTGFNEHCQECACVGGEVMCQVFGSCPIVACRSPIKEPGRCCPMCRGCVLNGESYEDGAVMPSRQPCHECRCINGQSMCQPVSCPRPACHSPVRKPGTCCPVCPTTCLHEGRRYNQGQEVHSRDPCSSCTCQSGSVRCGRRPCPPVDCERPTMVDGACCPSCDHPPGGCQYDGRRYREGDIVRIPGRECQRCECQAGRIDCQYKQCPQAHCLYPITENCCPSCNGCSFNDKTYRHSERFPDPRGLPCAECTCNYGNVTCERVRCDVSCTHPVERPGKCCPQCKECSYEGETHPTGAVFQPRLDPCVTCRCHYGSVTCDRQPCPPLRCPSQRTLPPPRGRCCPVCEEGGKGGGTDHCEYNGQRYREGREVPLDRDECERCVCRGGRIHCKRVDCPEAPCEHPTSGKCCPVCQGCEWYGEQYDNGEVFTHLRAGPCQECKCYYGNVRCTTKSCPGIRCSHPAEDLDPETCCPTCTDCEYQGSRYRDGSSFPSPSKPCLTCHCTSGSITCRPQQCPPTLCPHPRQAPGACCPSCETPYSCVYDSHTYSDGQTVPVGRHECEECVCEKGRIQCGYKKCPPLQCLHPLREGCCPSCTGCWWQGESLREGETVPDPRGSSCHECVCQRGTVTCAQVNCPPTHCDHPATPADHCCPSCTDCMYENALIRHGETTPSKVDPCLQCQCDRGTVTCTPQVCPHLPPASSSSCEQPPPGQCCPVCEEVTTPAGGCIYQGGRLEDGELLPPRSREGCEVCRCIQGRITCSRVECGPPACTHPVQGTCCPTCGDCSYDGEIVADGEVFHPSSDPCSECTCTAGTVTCRAPDCPILNCTHTQPRSRGKCCPTCIGCVYKGHDVEEGEVLVDPADLCRECECKDGSVSCSERPCPPTTCSHPLITTCGCQQCTSGCLWEGQELAEGDILLDPNNHCQRCKCQEGDLICQPIICPKLTCSVKKEIEGQCCPECKGCEMQGVEYGIGDIWKLKEDECTLCQCHPTMAICSRVECLTPCLNPVRQEGSCCPICPGTTQSVCEYSGNEYNDGETFSPTGSPCDTCECHNGSLNCYMKKCDVKFLCPEEDYADPLPGQCCGSCQKITAQCSRMDIGRVITPTDDPCFTCECADKNVLSCGINLCPELNCPIEEQVTLSDSCCPLCAACQIPSTGERLANGAIWQSPLEPCFYCHCNLGDIVCERMTCKPMVCPEGETLSKRPDECCPQCQAVEVVCRYGNLTYQIGDGWRVDECTSCFCDDNSQVSCRTEACPPLLCSASEDPSLVPGQCCPVCITKPATCTVFGDPHYHTFDGALVSFQGTCRYVMSADCDSGAFRVETTHNDRGTNGVVSWVDTLTLRLNDTKIDLLRGQKVMVNETQVTLPYLDSSSIVYIETSGGRILLFTQFGLKILWDGDSFAELSVPGTFQGALCGLCGNFNGFSQDDLTTRTGLIVTSAATFGNSWKVVSNETQCEEAIDTDTCSKAGYRLRKMANTKCAPIKGGLFSACHKVVAPDAYFASCVYDLCACEDVEKCQCDAFSAYAQACSKAGVTIHWRSEGLCAIGCVAELGFMFDECGPACPATCENRRRSSLTTSSRCFRPCVPGCQCPAHLVLHQGSCIEERACPNITHTETTP